LILRKFYFNKFDSLQSLKILFSITIILILFAIDLLYFCQKILCSIFHPYFCNLKNFEICFGHDFQDRQQPRKIYSSCSIAFQTKSDLRRLNYLWLMDLHWKPRSFSKFGNDYFRFSVSFFSFFSLRNYCISYMTNFSKYFDFPPELWFWAVSWAYRTCLAALKEEVSALNAQCLNFIHKHFISSLKSDDL